MTLDYLKQRRNEAAAALKQHEANAQAAHGAIAILDEIIALAEREAAEPQSEPKTHQEAP